MTTKDIVSYSLVVLIYGDYEYGSKRIKEAELLEMLLDRSKEVEHLRKELDETKKHIQTLEREVKTSGDINAAINKLTSATEEIQKFAAVISMASNNLTRK